MVTTTLDAMASGGIYDHLGGGFARYSVDERWLVPHFEKMLYDQALLVPLYLHAWQVTGEARYRQVVEETIGYVLARPAPPGRRVLLRRGRRLAEGEEGRFYVWTPAQIDAAVGPRARAGRARVVRRHAEAGNFEGRTILHPPGARRPGATAGGRAGPGPAVRGPRRAASARGSTTRSSPSGTRSCWPPWPRPAPRSGRDDWLDAAVANAEFLLTAPAPARRPLAALVAGRRRAPATTPWPADHAALVDAFVALAQATGEARWIDEARAVADTMLDHFWDADKGGLFTTADDGEALIVRQKDLLDNATPSANSMAAVGLLPPGRADRRAALRAPGRPDPAAARRGRRRRPVGVRRTCSPPSTCARAGVTEIAVAGDRPDLRGRRPAAATSPTPSWPGASRYDSPLWEDRRDGFAYVCRDYACQVPADSAEVLAGQLTG